ncbi:MAG TPA: tRNA epoxyqueuosine(34) reductase QueG [Pyrinomonadaceae bacterium]|nr:tRNA epoxyqueuosine(34) reductase QueG [Pyrinomonadaceae bacterium]
MRSFSQRIKLKAIEIGFDKVGLAEAAALVEEGKRLGAWLEAGFHGEMAWMDREPSRRSDPRLLFPEARSVIVVALNYYTNHKHVESGKQGKVSRYAWGDDYHEVVREKLMHLLDWIRFEAPEVSGRICVDTAPMMDKAWAVRAGLGWLGKHSNVITPELGSWVFIGEILLDLELDYDTGMVPDHCGTCTACIDACPTSAIVEPYVVDSRKCLSYATIEMRAGQLPADIAANQAGWLYGCDICQDVCPWNRFETHTSEPRFEPRGGETSLNLEKIAAMSHDQYVERFRRSAVKRTKLTGLKRNAAALSNSQALRNDKR